MQNRLPVILVAFFALTALLISGCSDEAMTEADLDVNEVTEMSSNAAASAKAGGATYEVTITNLTAGQPLTPPLLAVHRIPTGIFTVGMQAGFELKEIAENGNLGPMLATLSADPHVLDVKVSETGPLVPVDDPGGTGFSSQTTITVAGERGAKYISFASMLICTNDGFTGIDGQRLPKKVGDQITLQTNGYDAGTEINTEDFADLVPPCQALIGVSSADSGTGSSDPALTEDEVIRHHPGIQGTADLDPSVHGWSDPVAEIVITRTE